MSLRFSHVKFESESYFYVEYVKFRAFPFIISIPCCKAQIFNLIKIFLYYSVFLPMLCEAKSLIPWQWSVICGGDLTFPIPFFLFLFRRSIM